MNCAACGLNFERKDKGCQELECQNCKLKYHRYCYGYNNTDCICDPCSDNAKKPNCCLCGQKGLLKRLSDQSGVYVHVSCAIFAPHIEVINYHSMTFATKSQIDKKTKEKCSNCGKSGACIQCQDCQAFAHPHCIYTEQVEKAQEDIEIEQWIFHLKFQANNQDPNQLDVGQSDVKSELKDIQDTFALAVDKYNDKSKKRANISQAYKDTIKTTLDSMFDNFSLPQSNSQWSSLNKVESYCQVHMESHRLFCSCRKALNNKQMVQCDHCYEWYHFLCIKRKNVKDDSYVCDACKAWSSRRTKIDLENPKLLNFEDLVIPKEVYILHMIDLLPLLLYIEAIVKKLPLMPLTQNDYRNLKFYKLFLASLPIKPSTVIELDKVLLKERLQEELKQKMQNIIPPQLEQSEAFAEELVRQFKIKGYYFELGENKLIKSYIVTRKELKAQIKLGIAEGYLIEDTMKILDEQGDYEKVIKSPNPNLLLCIQRYKVAQTIRNQLRVLFDQEEIQSEHPMISNQLELTVYKQYTLLKNQKNKPNKQKLQDLRKMASMSNVTLKCLKIIDELLEEVTIFENENIATVNRKILEFPISSDVLYDSLVKYFEQEFIDEFKVELEIKIEKNQRLTEKEYNGLYNFDNIQKAAWESIVIKTVYHQLVEIHHKCQAQKKITISFCTEILEQISKCLLTSSYIEIQKIKLFKFKELYKQLNESITMAKLEDIEHQCFQFGFEMNVEARRKQLEEAQQFLENNSEPNLEESLESQKQLKSYELDQYVKQIEQQIDFVKQFYYLVYNKYDPLPLMIQRIKIIRDLDFRNELLYQVSIPETVHKDLQPVILNFKQMKWKCDCQRLLDQPSLPMNGNTPSNGTCAKRFNISEVKQLINAESQLQDQYYLGQLVKILQGYEDWMQGLNDFENQLNSPTIPQFNQLIRLINKNIYQDNCIQSKLWQYYIQMLWMQKAQEFIEQRATPQACKALVSCSQHVKLDQNNRLLLNLKENLAVMDDLGRKLKEYQEQRFLWTKSREQINNLQSYKSFYKYLENKPDAEQINEIYNLAKEYPIFKVKDIKEDLQEVKQVLAQYNDLVIKQLDNSQYIQQLQKIRTYYCCCFLKVKNFCVQLMYNLIKQQSLKCLKQLNPTEQILQRLEEINLLVALGGEEWYQKLSLTYKGKQDSTNSEDFKFIDCSLTDDFEWIKWMEESSQNINENFGIESKKQQKEHKIKKKQSEKKNLEGITEDLRQIQRMEILQYLKKFKNWKNVNEQAIRNLEAQIFMEQNFNKEKYLKEIEKIKSIIKQNKQLELSYEEFKKAYKQLVVAKKSSINQTSNKQSLQLECVKVIKKQQSQPTPSQQLASAIKLVSQQSLKSEPEMEKKAKPETPKQPTIIPQSIIMANDMLMYNPDGQIETTQTKPKNQLMSLGEINLQIKKKLNDNRELCVINPFLLTYDYQQAHFFPKTESITVTCDTYSPVKEVVEYLTQRKDGQFKMMIGWLYSKDLSVAGDLFKLADKLKHSKQCVGTKQGDFGFSLIYYEYLSKIKPTTKWILFKEEFDNPSTMTNLQKFHNLEKLKPHLCFVYYVKDTKECHNTILPQPVQYINILKAQQFKKVIENHKLQLKKQQTQQKKRELEPISDEDNNNQEQKEEIHSMLMEIPGIFNLLN